MTTSDETDDLDHPELRTIVHHVRALPLADRLTAMKAIVPAIAADMTLREFEGFIVELRLKGERFYFARSTTWPAANSAITSVHDERGRRARRVTRARPFASPLDHASGLLANEIFGYQSANLQPPAVTASYIFQLTNVVHMPSSSAPWLRWKSRSTVSLMRPHSPSAPVGPRS